MNAIRKITTIHEGSIKFKELENLNEKEVEVIVLSLENIDDKEAQEQRKNLMEFAGTLQSNSTDTSENVDKLIYGS
jgi:hypothetical protein